MSGINKMDISRPSRDQVAHFVQNAGYNTMAKAAFSAARTTAISKIATASDDRRFVKIVRVGNAL